jgi:ketosteroid isomerase-like protein
MSPADPSPDLDQFIEQYHRSADAFMRGSHEELARLYSQRDDVTLGNPFGPFVQGFEQVVQTMKRAAALYRDGRAVGFDSVARRVTPELAYLVEVERFESKMGGSDNLSSVALRCTSVLRPEDGEWRVVHRHADPITSPRSAESVIQK